MQVTILDPETAAAQPTASEELGLVDGEFQVFRNPREGETEGHFETGWTVRDALNKREPDGTSHPAVVLEKKTVDAQGSEITEEKTIDRETFLSWQQPAETVTDQPIDESVEADNPFMQYEELEIAEDLGETAVEQTAEVDELPQVVAENFEHSEPVEATEGAEAPESVTTEEQKLEAVDLQAIFADETSFERVLSDQTVSQETIQELATIAAQWKATLGVVKAIDETWNEDLRPAVDAMLRELPNNVSSLQRLRHQTEDIAASVQQLVQAREYGDTESAQRAFNQLNLDMAIPTFRAAARTFNEPDELLPSGRQLRTQNEVVFEKLSHARSNRGFSSADYRDLVAYAQSHLSSGTTASQLIEGMGAETYPILQSWQATEQLANETAAMSAVLPVEDVATMCTRLSSSLEDLQYQPNANIDDLWNIKRLTILLRDELEAAQGRFYKLQISAENTLGSRPRT